MHKFLDFRMKTNSCFNYYKSTWKKWKDKMKSEFISGDHKPLTQWFHSINIVVYNNKILFFNYISLLSVTNNNIGYIINR